jgi:DnaD/phage-associated family protein
MEQIMMTIEELDRLLALEDGDAALVFLHGKRGREAPLGEARLLAARKKLGGAGMLPSSYSGRPSYSQSEIVQCKLTDPGFGAVVDETERLLGKALSLSDLQMLIGIRKWHGLPSNVLLLLLYHCEAEQRRRGKPLSVRAMDKEAQIWEQEGVLDEAAAEGYISRKERSREKTAVVFHKLGIFGREPSATEKGYVASWIDLGFTVEAIALAYDKTVINTGKLTWKYCDTILRRWHENGWHTPGEIETYDKKPSAYAKKGAVTGSYDRNREAMKRIREEESQHDSRPGHPRKSPP